MDETQTRLLRCFGAVFPGLNETELGSASLGQVEGWDSVATITLLSLVEEEFGVEFQPEDLARQTSFERILDHLRAKGLA
jgi:acyl carrier protein